MNPAVKRQMTLAEMIIKKFSYGGISTIIIGAKQLNSVKYIHQAILDLYLTFGHKLNVFNLTINRFPVVNY